VIICISFYFFTNVSISQHNTKILHDVTYLFRLKILQYCGKPITPEKLIESSIKIESDTYIYIVQFTLILFCVILYANDINYIPYETEEYFYVRGSDDRII
jgi:hypothetical protein